MADYSHELLQFLEHAVRLGERIAEDAKMIKEISEGLEKSTNYVSLISQRKEKSDAFIEECHAFARVINAWSREYPELLREFREVVRIVINSLMEIPELTIIVRGNEVQIHLDEKKLKYEFIQIHNKAAGTLALREGKNLERLTADENTFLKEIAEVISLDLHIQSFMNNIQELSVQYRIDEASATVLRIGDPNHPDLIVNMHKMAAWWLKVNDMLHNIKGATIAAIKMDKKAAEKLHRMLHADELELLRQKRLELAKAGLTVVSKIALTASGLTLVQVIVDGVGIYKTCRDTAKKLREM